ncbi:MAG TPA: elongation factor P [Cytophagaceae bacterium]|jgi:elongation factor P|nr:elongation factor P [Cytophagaceae bacterium]
MAKISDISNGTFLRYNNDIVVVLEYQHRTPGNLRAFYQVKMRNMKTGKLIEERYRPDEQVEIVRVEVKEQQYLYRDGSNLVCMDNETFDQTYIPEETVGENVKFLKEGMVMKISFDGETAIYAEAPNMVELEVTYTEPGVKGDTATKTLKPATLETGAEIRVPLFVNIGEKIKIDTRTGEYVERVK